MRNRTSLDSTATANPQGGLFRLLQISAAALVAARWLVPPEAAVLGDSLWITQLWLLLVLLWGWDAYRRFDYRVKLDAFDLAVGLIVLGHVVSTVYILAGHGNSRSALNLMWEWVALGASFFLLRRLLRTQTDQRRMLTILVAAAVMLAGQGIWQHYVELPAIVADYEQLARHLAENPGDPKLARELARLGVPADPAARVVWENRLKSTEPFATFALANTLAGFLAAFLFAGFDISGLIKFFSTDRPRFGWKAAGRIAGLLLVAFCLVLTKSRTAWVGFSAGLLVWVMVHRAGIAAPLRRWWKPAVGVGGLGVLLFVVAALSGGFDLKVLTESSKSLSYRFQYWSGGLGVVAERPILGTGPGNFRQHYLKHKLPESSEEILDPHNWILDLWTSGGVLALVGFTGLIVFAIRRGRRAPEPTPNDDDSRAISNWELGAGLGFPLVILAVWLAGEPVRYSLACLFAGWCLASWLFRDHATAAWPKAGIYAGAVALLVHLLGAGGIEMPLVAQTIFLLVILAHPQDPSAEAASRPKTVLLISLAGVLAFSLCFFTATLPDWYCGIHLANGDASLSQDQNFLKAERSYQQAREADGFSPEPAERLADLDFGRWQATSNEADFEKAMTYAKEAVRLDPVSYRGYRRIARWYFQRAQAADPPDGAAEKAVKYYAEATARYPNSAMLRAESALAFDLAGQKTSASEEAKRALRLDQINHKAGHRDKYLPEPLVERLKQLATDTSPELGPEST